MDKLSINGVWSDELGLKLRHWERSLQPQNRDELMLLSGVSGSTLIAESDGNLEASITLDAAHETAEERLKLYKDFYAWIRFKGRNLPIHTNVEKPVIVFGNELDRYYLAERITSDPFNPNINRSSTTITIEHKPYAIDFEKGDKSRTLIKDVAQEFEYEGTYYTLPLIELTTSSTTNQLVLTFNDNVLTINKNVTAGKLITINTENKEIRYDDDLLVEEVEGMLPKVFPKTNTIEANTSCNISLTYDIKYEIGHDSDD